MRGKMGCQDDKASECEFRRMIFTVNSYDCSRLARWCSDFGQGEDWRAMIGAEQGFRIVVELIKLLLDGTGVIPLFNNARHGKIEEFPSAIPLIPPEKSFSPFLPPPG
jgi:hypothetical protein